MIPRPRFSVPIWKVIVTLALVIIVTAIVLPGIKQGRALWPSLKQCHWEWIAAAVGCQIGVYLTIASIFGASMRALGTRLPASTLVFVSMAFLFTTKAFAVAGLATLVFLLGRRSVGADIGQAAAGTFYLADYAGFLLLILGVYFGTGTLGVSAHTAVISSILLIGLLAGTVALLSAPRPVTRFADYVALGGARLARRPDADDIASKARAVVGSFYARWDELSRRRRVLLLTTVLALAMHACETATVACCARAFDAPVTFGAAASGYVAGNLAALVSFLPGGVGFFEGAMAAALTRLGHIPFGPALAATLSYRILTLWLPLPLVLAFVRELRSTSDKLSSSQAT